MDAAYDIVGTATRRQIGHPLADMTLGDVSIWLIDRATRTGAGLHRHVKPAYIVIASATSDASTKADVVWRGAAGDVWVLVVGQAGYELCADAGGIVPEHDVRFGRWRTSTGNRTADIPLVDTERGELCVQADEQRHPVQEFRGTVPRPAPTGRRQGLRRRHQAGILSRTS